MTRSQMHNGGERFNGVLKIFAVASIANDVYPKFYGGWLANWQKLEFVFEFYVSENGEF